MNEHLRVVVMELFRRRTTGGLKAGVAYNRAKGWWSSSKLDSRYNALKIRRKVLLQVVDALKGLGLIEHKDGFKDWGYSGIGRNSRMRAKIGLNKLLRNAGITSDMIERARNEESIILSTKIKVDALGTRLKNPIRLRLAYREIPFTDGARKEIGLYRNLLGNFKITQLKQAWTKADTLNTYSVFNDSNLFDLGDACMALGGNRFPRKRTKIRIDGFEAIELDYRCFQLRLLYARHGIDYSEDGYVLPGFKSKIDRRICKKLVLASINADSKESAILATKKLIRDDSELDTYWKSKKHKVEDLLDKFLAKHSLIATEFFKGIGLRLMKTDSDICMAIIERFVAENKPILTVHDSFLVKKEDEKLLRQLMIDNFEKFTGVTVGNPAKLIH
ncbi:MAG: hypothetical protein IPG43_14260 [Proteobacteria bacterium]|nr:hypothetical protein [Pseudomonadota bacterium]